MKNLALPRIQQLHPYRPPLDGRAQYDGLLLDFNERGGPPQPAVTAALGEFARNPRLQLYPEYYNLESKIAAYAGVPAEQIMITNGTDQGIDIIVRSFCDAGDAAVIPAPSFAMYAQCARIAGATVVQPLYTENPATGGLEFPLAEVLAAITPTTKLVVICNPNNPTGTLVPLQDIEQIAARARGAAVYIDEAYVEFSGGSAASLIRKYPNIVITRTFSKAFGLAGLRIGYIIAHPRHIAELLKVRGPYDVNQVAVVAALAALSDTAGMQRYVREVVYRARPFTERFFRKQRVAFCPSAANFLLLRPARPLEVLERLRQHGVLVRPQDKPAIEGSLRLSIGTLEQMQRFTEIYAATVLGL